VEVVASLPCYSAANVDRQRGDGVFDKSIAALRQLNVLGYGQPGSGRVLNLVYNPQGPSLPPDQQVLQADYKRELFEHFGIVFNELLALTNMPIQRFGSTLVSKGSFDAYMDLLKGSYQPQNLAGVMCRSWSAWTGRAGSTTATSTSSWTCRWARAACAGTCATCSGPACRRSRSACPATAMAARPGRAAAAAVRWRIERACSKEPRR
jgi:hypothetical protein